MDYATINDLESVYRTLNEEEKSKAEKLIGLASSLLRVQAKKVHKNLDEMIEEDADIREVARLVVIASVTRVLSKRTNQSGFEGPVTQYSESALGYSVSGSFLNPGEDIYFLNNELKRLGLKRQRYGVMDLYGSDD